MQAAEGKRTVFKACRQCRSRKVKCDRKAPCLQCVRRGDEQACDWGGQSPPPAPAQQDEAAAELKSKLDRLEQLLFATKKSTLAASLGSPRKRARAEDVEDVKQLQADERARVEQLETRLTRFETLSQQLLGPPGFSSKENRLATSVLPGSLSMHLLGEFFKLHGHSGLGISPRLIKGSAFNAEGRMTGVSPMTSALVAALIVKGAQMSGHSSILGKHALPPPPAGELPSGVDYTGAGQTRMPFTDQLREKALQACDESGAHRIASLESVRLLSLVAHVAKGNSSSDASRSYIRSAVDHLRTLLDSETTPPHERRELQQSLGPTLFEADSGAVARNNKPSYISDSDLKEYFLIDTEVPTLDVVDAFASVESAERQLRSVWFYILRLLREFGLMMVEAKRLKQHVYKNQLLRDNFIAIDRLSAFLTSLEGVVTQVTPANQDSLNLVLLLTDCRRVVVDLEFLQNRAIYGDYRNFARLLGPAELGTLNAIYTESRSRTRQGIKAIIGIFQIMRLRPNLIIDGFQSASYSIAMRYSSGGNDLLFMHGQAVSLDRVPEWTDIALGRYGDEGGPASKAEEVTEDELEHLMVSLQRTGWTWKHAAHYVGVLKDGIATIRAAREARRNRQSPTESNERSTFGGSSLQHHSAASFFDPTDSINYFQNWQAAETTAYEMPVEGVQGSGEGNSASISEFEQFMSQYDIDWSDYSASSDATVSKTPAYDPFGPQAVYPLFDSFQQGMS